MRRNQTLHRRQFLGTAAAAVAAPYLIPSGVFGYQGKPGANERIAVANIGVGGMGTGHFQRMLQFQKLGVTRVLAVCDCDDQRLAEAVKIAGPGVEPYRDYRYILQRRDVDAVVIATPDHWHAVQTVHCCDAGKHVYVEKPASVTVEEGRAMVAAARRNQRAVQVGAQGRTGLGAWYTCRAIRNGIVGKVQKVTCWHYANPVGGLEPDSPPPPGLDWDLWLGPLPWRPFNRAYHPANFRWFLESGGGQIRDRGAHQFSTILWCMDADKQVSYTVEAAGTPPTKGLWDCPIDM
jgi:predicted dehydrogenase